MRRNNSGETMYLKHCKSLLHTKKNCLVYRRKSFLKTSSQLVFITFCIHTIFIFFVKFSAKLYKTGYTQQKKWMIEGFSEQLTAQECRSNVDAFLLYTNYNCPLVDTWIFASRSERNEFCKNLRTHLSSLKICKSSPTSWKMFIIFNGILEIHVRSN